MRRFRRPATTGSLPPNGSCEPRPAHFSSRTRPWNRYCATARPSSSAPRPARAAERVAVDPEVVRRKFHRELALWDENAAVYRRRGWILLSRGELQVEVGFLGRLPLG